MEAISREFRVAIPWELLYADDLVVTAETEEDLIKRLNEWKNNVENKSMRVNMNKTKVMWRTSEASAEGCKMAVWYVAEVLVVIHYNVLVVIRGYTRSVVV